MEKRSQAVPTDEEIRAALASYTDRPVSAEKMWANIGGALESQPRTRWQWPALQPWLALGSAAVLCLIIILSRPTPPPPQPPVEIGPQIMRFAAPAPITASARPADGGVTVELTAVDEVLLGESAAAVRIVRQEGTGQAEVGHATASELAGARLTPGEVRHVFLPVPLPSEPGTYQVQIQLEVVGAEGPHVVDLFTSLTINREE